MDAVPSIMLVAMVVLLFFSAIASCIETAITASSKIKLQSFCDSGIKSAKKALKLKDIQQRVISTTLILNNVVNVSLSTVAALFFSFYLKNINIVILTGILTFILLVFGEITPKSIAAKYPERIMIFFVGCIDFFVFILKPLVKILNFISNIFLKPFHTSVESEVELVTEEELKTMVNISHKEGVIESEEKKILHNVFEFRDLNLKDIMTPKVDMICVDINANYEELEKIFRVEKYTRIPVYEESIDNIIGIVILKDFFSYVNDIKKFKIKDILREPYFLYENKKVIDTLNEMKKTLNGIVIVLDEYGITSGMVTMEDILEELVGDIKDEYDAEEDEEIKKINDYEYVIDGSVRLDDINEKLGTNIESSEFESIGGVVISSIEKVPERGEEVDYGDYHLRVEKMDNNRISKVRLFLPYSIEKKE